MHDNSLLTANTAERRILERFALCEVRKTRPHQTVVSRRSFAPEQNVLDGDLRFLAATSEHGIHSLDRSRQDVITYSKMVMMTEGQM